MGMKDVSVETEQSKRQRADFADQQAEVAGVPNGKMRRFLTGDSAPRTVEEKEKQARARAFMTQLDLLLLDPAYARLHREVNTLLNEAQDKLTSAVDKLSRRMEYLEELVADMEDRATKLPDGTAVFRDRTGALRAADGRHLSKADTALLTIPVDAPSYEQYGQARDALNSARARMDRYGELQTELEDIDRKTNDPSNPASLEEKKDLKDRVEDAIKEIDEFEQMKPTFDKAATPKAEALVSDLENDLSVPVP